jgi:hypothetical protein
MFWNRPAQSLNKPKENSFDFKLIMAFHICMMVLMMTGALQFEWEVGFVAILLVPSLIYRLFQASYRGR